LTEENFRFARQCGATYLTVHLVDYFHGKNTQDNQPTQWYDVLLGGPKGEEQLEELKRRVRNVSKAGISTIGYNFSIAGVYGSAYISTLLWNNLVKLREKPISKATD